MQRIGIQGIKGSFHYEAALKYFGENIETLDCLSFKELCESLKAGKADMAVMAIENTLAGSLLQNYNLLHEYHLKVIGEVYLRIQMNLLALPGVFKQDIKVVQSHPIAIRQCQEYLWGMSGIEIRERDDTAACAKEIQHKGLSDTAAIASLGSAELYGLEVLDKEIETYKQNYTRFLAVSIRSGNGETANKASLSLQLGHYSGSLVDVLLIFKEFNINLTKLQSVPIMGKPYEYAFHIDLEWEDYEAYEKAIQQVLKKASNLSVFGEYLKGNLRS